MGKPKFSRRKYDNPLHPWKAERIQSERDLIKKYGLKNHREVWKAKTLLRNYRRQARMLLGKVEGSNPQVKKESNQLLLHLTRMSVLPENCSLDDVLALDTESILSRRLQTLVYHRGFANTVKHARELVSHGHIAIGDQKMTIPGYLVEKTEENLIAYTAKSPLNTLSHPARPKTEVQKFTPGSIPPPPKETPTVTETQKTPEPPKKEAPAPPKQEPVPTSEPKKEESTTEKIPPLEQPVEKKESQPSAEKPLKQKTPKKRERKEKENKTEEGAT